ncbi:hypothetical protein [Sulfitobacter sp.]|uniref:hypothetical protein n=1 Tax=Sulfitobacter sp. TaxID=1903071 RepID=UPI00356708FE
MRRPTFEELREEADAFIGPPQPPKFQSSNTDYELSDEALASLPDLAGRFSQRQSSKGAK